MNRSGACTNPSIMNCLFEAEVRDLIRMKSRAFGYNSMSIHFPASDDVDREEADFDGEGEINLFD